METLIAQKVAGMPDGAYTLAASLIRIRRISEEWEWNRAEKRTDFLLRGICGKEVDGLLDDAAPLPAHLEWKKLHGSHERLAEALAALRLPPLSSELETVVDELMAWVDKLE